MIEGINILNSTNIIGFSFVFLLIGILSGFSILLGIAVTFADKKFGWILLSVLGLIIFSTNIHIARENTYVDYVRYEVTIDDTVSLKEFNDKYEILEQRGEIYVIREKETE